MATQLRIEYLTMDPAAADLTPKRVVAPAVTVTPTGASQVTVVPIKSGDMLYARLIAVEGPVIVNWGPAGFGPVAGNLTSGSNVVPVASTAGIVIGMPVTDTSSFIPANTIVGNIVPGVSISLVNAATGAAANATGTNATDALTFGDPIANELTGYGVRVDPGAPLPIRLPALVSSKIAYILATTS